jgi:hypothetical protein
MLAESTKPCPTMRLQESKSPLLLVRVPKSNGSKIICT